MITPAFAQTPAGAGGVDMIMQIVPFVLIFVIMYFLIIRPQQRKARDHQEMIKNVRRGDTVVTTGGIIGKVTKVSDDAELEDRDRRRRAGASRPRHDRGRPRQGRTRQVVSEVPVQAPRNKTKQSPGGGRKTDATRCCAFHDGRPSACSC